MTGTWADLAIGLYERLHERGAEITYNFSNLEVWVPMGTEPDAAQAHWKLNGSIVISSRDTK